jgi:hypothetical protein
MVLALLFAVVPGMNSPLRTVKLREELLPAPEEVSERSEERERLREEPPEPAEDRADEVERRGVCIRLREGVAGSSN